MTPANDDQLRRAFLDGDAGVAFGATCPPADTIWDAARGELSPDATAPIADHIATCAACGRAWEVAAEFGPHVGRSGMATASATVSDPPAWWSRSQPWAMAALVILTLGMGAWIARFELRSRDGARRLAAEAARLEGEVARERETRVAAEQLARNLSAEISRRSRPLVNVPLFELSDDVLRGDASSVTVSVPATASHLTLLLSSSRKPAGESFAAEALDAGGAVAWRAEGLRPNETHTFTLTVERTSMPDGAYRVRLLRAAPAPATLVHEYAFTVRTR